MPLTFIMSLAGVPVAGLLFAGAWYGPSGPLLRHAARRTARGRGRHSHSSPAGGRRPPRTARSFGAWQAIRREATANLMRATGHGILLAGILIAASEPFQLTAAVAGSR
jgi:hypothetical protein